MKNCIFDLGGWGRQGGRGKRSATHPLTTQVANKIERAGGEHDIGGVGQLECALDGLHGIGNNVAALGEVARHLCKQRS